MIPDPVAVAEAGRRPRRRPPRTRRLRPLPRTRPRARPPPRATRPRRRAPEPEIPLIPTSMRQGKSRTCSSPRARGEGEELSGGFYEGEFVDNKKHGAGERRFLMARSRGAFAEDQMHGEGRYTYVSGDVYRGVFEKGKHGQGEYFLRRASRRSWGDGRRGVRGGPVGLLRRLLLPSPVRDGKPTGEGTYTWSASENTQTGEWGSGRRVHRPGPSRRRASSDDDALESGRGDAAVFCSRTKNFFSETV